MYKVDEISQNGDNEQFEELEDAEDAAVKRSINDSFVGVWDDDGLLVSIAYMGTLYSC